MYALTFGTGAWFADRGVPTFYPLVTVTFTVEVADDGRAGTTTCRCCSARSPTRPTEGASHE